MRFCTTKARQAKCERQKIGKPHDKVKVDETGKSVIDITATCESKGGVDVTFVLDVDGTASLTCANDIEMTADESQFAAILESTGASAGEEGRYGRMAAENG